MFVAIMVLTLAQMVSVAWERRCQELAMVEWRRRFGDR